MGGSKIDDLISRKALLEKAWEADTQCGYVQVVDVGDIEDAPAVDAAPVVRGEWIELHEENGHEVGTCSHCRHVRIVDNYCPNCGAKMNGGNDDENFSSLRRIAGGDD